MKTFHCILAFLCISVVVGCNRSYQANQLVGVWQSTQQPTGFTFTFFKDHTFTCGVASPKNLTQFGEWALNAKQLTIILRSNNWTAAITTNRNSYRIIALTDSALALKNLDDAAERPNRTFTKVK